MTDYLVVLILGLLAVGAVAFPFLAGVARYDDAADLDADVRRYREALAADTVRPPTLRAALRECPEPGV
jgi:hypothetical protein